ncbi:MAG TPA: phage tail sheath subtilisin-like domain-containing protein [Nocardioidaceae bacterium]
MATTYQAPGVYVEDVPPSTRPLEGASTSVAAFAGVVPDNVVMPELPDGSKPTVAKVGEIVLLTRWEDFPAHFGVYGDGNAVLAQAVFGYFLNGGGRCYVRRVAADGDLSNLNEIMAGWQSYDDISIVAVPGATNKTQHGAIVAHCALMQDRVAVLDGVQPTKVDSVKPEEINLNGQSSAGSYAALYYPWLRTAGPDPSGALHTVPPSGHVAGVFARSDARRGVHKAPANEPVLGAVDLTVRYSKQDQAVLGPVGINLLRPIGGAVTVWGARTLSNDVSTRYVSTQRYLCFLRDTITAGTQWAVFEPNGTSLWKALTRNVTDFLRGQWQDGALLGETAEQAFYVRCDEATNPPASRDLGRVVVEVGVAIVRPAEFIVFRVQQTSGE